MKYLILVVMTIFLVNCKSQKVSSAATATSEPTPTTVNKEKFIENDAKALVAKKYQVVQLKEGDALYAFPKSKPIVTFGENGKLNTKLSKNSCGGTYEANSKKINFSADGCTEMCCDTKADQVFQGLLSNSTFFYKMTATDLILTNENKIIRLRIME